MEHLLELSGFGAPRNACDFVLPGSRTLVWASRSGMSLTGEERQIGAYAVGRAGAGFRTVASHENGTASIDSLWSSKPVRRRGPTLGRLDSCAAPLGHFPLCLQPFRPEQ